MEVDTLEQGIDYVNAHDNPLALYVFTQKSAERDLSTSIATDQRRPALTRFSLPPHSIWWLRAQRHARSGEHGCPSRMNLATDSTVSLRSLAFPSEVLVRLDTAITTARRKTLASPTCASDQLTLPAAARSIALATNVSNVLSCLRECWLTSSTGASASIPTWMEVALAARYPPYTSENFPQGLK